MSGEATERTSSSVIGAATGGRCRVAHQRPPVQTVASEGARASSGPGSERTGRAGEAAAGQADHQRTTHDGGRTGAFRHAIPSRWPPPQFGGGDHQARVDEMRVSPAPSNR